MRVFAIEHIEGEVWSAGDDNCIRIWDSQTVVMKDFIQFFDVDVVFITTRKMINYGAGPIKEKPESVL